MLTGVKPFAGDSVVTITYAIMNKDPNQPSQIPYRLWQVIQRSLEKSPMSRYASAGDMANAIRDAVRPEADPVGYSGNSAPYNQASVPAPPVQNYSLPAAVPGYTQAPYGQTPYGQNPYSQAPQGGAYQYPGPAAGNGPANPFGMGNPMLGAAPASPNYTQAPYGMPPPGPLPIYYPPAPRKPLLNPSQIEFLRRLFITILLVGTLFMLVAVGASALTEAVKRYNAQQRDQQIQRDAVSTDSRTPLPERIAALTQYRDKLESESEREKVSRDIAVLYQQLGKQSLDSRQGPEAEKYFQTASELDPHNPAYYTNLASVYEGEAVSQSDPEQRAQLLKEAGDNWAQAADKATDPAQRKSYSQQAALDLYQYASELANRGDASQRSEIRQALYSARERVDISSQLASQIQALLSSVR
jgi:serine/threonine-protein kinase